MRLFPLRHGQLLRPRVARQNSLVSEMSVQSASTIPPDLKTCQRDFGGSCDSSLPAFEVLLKPLLTPPGLSLNYATTNRAESGTAPQPSRLVSTHR
jgi:hypothetical protein